MGDAEKKLAFQKSTGSWLIVQPGASGGYEPVEALDDDPANWTGEAYDLAVAHPKASAELKPKLAWYRDNMLGEPTGPLDENGKTTETPLSAYEAPAAPAPSQTQAAPVVAEPVVEESPWAAFANASTRLGRHVMGDNFLKPLPNEDETEMPEEDRDFARGLAQGFTFRWGDEGTAAVEGELLPQPAGTPGEMRAAGRGINAPLMTEDEREDAVEAETLARERQSNAQAQERSPWAYGIGEGVGMTPAAIATAPVFGTAGTAGVPWQALAARNAAQGAVMGAAAGAGGGEDGSRLSDAAMGAGTGAAGGAAGSALGTGIGAGARWAGDKVDEGLQAVRSTPTAQKVSQYAGNLANRSRAAATGAYGAQLKKLAETEGFDFVDNDLGEGVERLFPPEPGFLGLPKPRTARDYAALAAPKANQIGASIDDSLRQMDAEGVSAPVIRNPLDPDERAVLDVLDEEIAGASNPMNIGDDDAVMRGALEALRGKTLAAVEPQAAQAIDTLDPSKLRLKPTELAAMKRSLERSGYASEATKGLPAGVQREANRIAAAGPREALRSAAARQAQPNTLAAWERGNRDYPIAKTVAELAEGRAAQEQGNQIVSLPGAMATAVGGPLAAPSVGAWEVAKRYGADAAANAMRGVQRATQLQHGPRPAPSPVPQQVTQALGARAGVPWGALARRGQPLAAQPGSDSQVQIGEAQITKRDDGRGNAETSMGHDVQKQVATALIAYPNALGPFKQQLKAAEGDPVRLSAAISDAMQDPRWAEIVQPQLDEVAEFRRKKKAAGQ